MSEETAEEGPVAFDFERGGRVLRITIGGGKGNIVDTRVLAGIEAAIARIHPEVTAIVFRGAGKHFSFGASVEEHQRDLAPEMLRRFHALFGTLAELSVPTCALVDGQCLGGGLELASWCTWVAATPNAKLGQPEIQLGVFPPMGSVLLPWRIGGSAALDLCVSGRSITAERARELGLVTEVTDDLEAWWDAFYEENLQGRSASSLRFAERAVRARLYEDLRHELPKIERLYVEELMATHDANEGIAAFMERRTPNFEDR